MGRRRVPTPIAEHLLSEEAKRIDRHRSVAALAATVNLPASQVKKVEFFRNGYRIASLTTPTSSTATSTTWTYNWVKPAANTYLITAEVTDLAGVVTESAQVRLEVDKPPTLVLNSPKAGTSIKAPASILFDVDASDPDGSIARVEFWQGTTKLGQATGYTFDYTWKNVPAGTYSVFARAYDDLGLYTDSPTVSITVTGTSTPTTVTLSAPANNGSVTLPVTIPLTASVTGSATIASVSFFDGTTQIGSASQSPYTINWVNPAAGTHTLTAKATDSAGTVTTSAPVSVTVLAHPAPTVSLTTPANGMSYTTLAPLSLTATASTTAPNTTIAKVDFLDGSALIGTASQSPYGVTWSNPTAGSHTLTARATDSTGATTTSAPVTVSFTPEIKGVFFIHADHLGTPRVIADENQAVVWRWDYDEPFGESAPNEDPGNTGAKFEFNLRFPGQVFDRETNTSYNYFRDYDPGTGRYIQSDPIGLAGGINTYSYVEGNPVGKVDPKGLFVPRIHWEITAAAADVECPRLRNSLPRRTRDSDFIKDSQKTSSSPMHSMCIPGDSPDACRKKISDYIESSLSTCSLDGLANALHATQDGFSHSHKGQTWFGTLSWSHIKADISPAPDDIADAVQASIRLIRRFKAQCSCQCNN